MNRRLWASWMLLLASGAVSLVTVATCNQRPTGFGYQVFSTNDDLVEDVFGLFCDDEDDCDDD